MSTTSDPKLALDPGPKRRQRMSFCKCCTLTITVPLVCFLVWAVGSAVYTGVRHLHAPQRVLYHNAKHANATDPPIYPLITDEQTFDILATVWLRGTAAEEKELRAAKVAAAAAASAASTSSSASVGAPSPSPSLMQHKDLGTLQVQITMNDTTEDVRVDHALYSEVIFTGLRLTDKHASAKVNFTLPITEKFKERLLLPDDLRVAFMLVPSADSGGGPFEELLDVDTPRAGAAGYTEDTEKTMLDLALESFAISVPLLQIHPTPSLCAPSNTSLEASESDATSTTSAATSTPSVRRPYLVTRTQLRVIREQNLFNGTAYRAAQKKLKATACGLGFGFTKPFFTICDHTYENVGNLETLFELEVSNPSEDESETRWAYAPYLNTKQNSNGPQDLLPIPVTRENCTGEAEPTPDPESIEVSLDIAFAARSPAKSKWADSMAAASAQAFNHSSTDCEKMNQQRTAELWSGAFGHRFYDDAHPRRRVFLDFTAWFSFTMMYMLYVPYWWGRLTTAGISFSGALLTLASYFFEFSTVLYRAYPDDITSGETLTTAFIAVVLPLIMLRAIYRVELGWNRWYPTLSRSPATHQERRSERLDNEIPWAPKLALVLAMALVYHFGKLREIRVVAEFSPLECPSEEDPLSAMEMFVEELTSALANVGAISQMMLNHRLKTFGGGYRIGAIFALTGSIAHLLEFMPWFVGRLEFRGWLSVGWLLWVALQVPLAWQALTLPPVKVDKNDED
ncbi:hypothetical protein HMN09_00017400 [Mycena chlorophos]|uniref:Uncharacterized protein n=1 Tax=Mycena chlorophos TaxID=658473 RepID=A0A8H6TRF8_MYCCL|nr:hypothetical protein HMN09_00017400 [Mycena chlorophos]